MSNKNRVISGLCGGLGNYTNIDSGIWRLLFVILMILTSFTTSITIYVIICIIYNIYNED